MSDKRPVPAGMALAILAVVGLLACDVPEPPGPTGGTAEPLGRCGRGLVVVSSDYQSTNLSLLDTAGQVLSESFISSASAAAQLSAPLSGDVGMPTEPQLGPELVLLDRYPASVLTWVEVATGTVRAQLNVATGFAANPQDYVKVSESKAYGSRYEGNPAPGAEPFDEGNDVLIIDPRVPEILNRIDLLPAMVDAPGFLPRPNRMVRLEGVIYVLLSGYSADYLDSAPSRIVTIDIGSDAIAGVTVLEGLHGCVGLAIGPRFDVTGQPAVAPPLAVSCSGKFDGANASMAESGVVVLSTAGPLPSEVDRWTAAELVGQPLGMSLDFIDHQRLLITVLGLADPLVLDGAIELDTETNEVRELLRSDAQPFQLGEVRCMTAVAGAGAPEDGMCGGCFIADSERNRVHRFAATTTGLEVVESLLVDTMIGLPPRQLGRF
ncbi:MAG: hypothetical protein DRI90_07435 [Deltaproteobacteria bacterium]|nr:MAG: hypothetical protein DRI90_07435 [Deltaproteobacteria bacterium]